MIKLLLLGHKPYISWLLKDLEKEGFLDTLAIDVIEVGAVRSKPKPLKRKIKSAWKKLRKLTVQKFRLILAIRKGYDTEALNQYFNLEDSSIDHQNVNYHSYDRVFDVEWTSSFDRMIVATYGGLIAPEQFDSPKLGTWNIHPSVLPQLKGGYPTLVQALDPNFQTGTTIHEMTAQIDVGRVIFQKNNGSADGKTNLQLFRQSARDAARMLKEWQDGSYQVGDCTLSKVEGSTCKQYHKTSWDLRSYGPGTDVEKLVKAYNIPHMYPFIFLLDGASFVQLLEVEKGGDVKDGQRVYVANVRSETTAALFFHDKKYYLKVWMVNGQLYQAR